MNNNKLVLVLMLLSMQLYSCNGQNRNVVKASDSTNTKGNSIEALKIYYNKAHETGDSVKYGKLFFESFPDDFKAFNLLYGYNDQNGGMPLFSLYEKHISFFCRLRFVQSESIFFNKIIKLGINGVWDADAVNLLQDCIINHVCERPDLTVKELKHFKNEEVRSFWKFLFDSPHPDDAEVQKRYHKLYENIVKLDVSIANLMKDEYTKLLKESDKHGK